MSDRINNENENITDFNFVIGWLYTDGQKKVKLLMRTETEVLKTEIHSREVERDPGWAMKLKEGIFTTSVGSLKLFMGKARTNSEKGSY